MSATDTEVRRSLDLTKSEHKALDGIIRPHLRLEPHVPVDNDENDQDNSCLPSATKKGISEKSLSTKFPRPAVHQTTVEPHSKRRMIVLKRNTSKYDHPSPDPNSEAKSVVIRRVQGNLEDWNKQLKDIMDKKDRDDIILQSELNKRDNEIKELKEKYSAETKLRIKTEKKRDNLAERLKNTEEELDHRKEQLDQLHNHLTEYELAYEQLESSKVQVEEELQTTNEQLQQSEMMRRRLNDHVTELQGQLAIEEQRSKFCTIQ